MMLVTGASGFVGGKIMQQCREVIACPSLRQTTEEDVRRIVEESGADTIVHTAAIADIGVCEKHPDASYRANVQLPVWLAKAAKNRKLICFSSDQVYGGMMQDGPYTEDAVKPNNLYAAHKLEMEQRVLDILPDAVMLRAEWMYDYISKKPNYFLNVLHAADTLRFSSKQYRGITYVKEVADNMEAVIRLPGGVYNFGSETTQSMFDITKAFAAFLGKDIPLEDVAAPHNLWMNCEKAKRHGVVFRTVEDGLRQCALDSGYRW
ncbi:MAG: NAD-dependent epimerase/dehydratase family protein [Ruminococcaceae bacterium]|nr:NAD-dependent epimerase/dehydratase family protein [Oscillospiraceae bacterium]